MLESLLSELKDIWSSSKGEVLGTAIIGLTIVFWKRIFGWWSRFIHTVEFPTFLSVYRNSVETETLRVKHSWKLEGQDLKDFIVPASIRRKGQTNREKLDLFLDEEIEVNHCPRLIFLGEAGSGKSVSMGTVARKILSKESINLFIPVLVGFTEIKAVTSEKGMEEIVISVLTKHGFITKTESKAKDYAIELLYKGKILLLLDGLDELETVVRARLCFFLNNYLKRHTQIPFVISSRTPVWNQSASLFSSLNFKIIEIAEFTPLEIRQFIYQLNFGENKSADRLVDIVNAKPYLLNLAVNPLILSIITFLYSQPKRILPDNRVKFYAECIDALMEKWDIVKFGYTPNQFETVDKKAILSQLAYESIVNSATTDEDIHINRVMHVITTLMMKLSRPVERREAMLTEIVVNAELLVKLSSEYYKFPHRTFSEYFAANHFHVNHKYEELIELYTADKGKWQETLVLFCGINEDIEISTSILKRLASDFGQPGDKGNEAFVFRVLVESAVIDAQVAKELLILASEILSKEIDPSIVEQLGYIASNNAWEHHRFAKQILLSLMEESLSDADFQEIVLSLVHVNDRHIEKLILSHLDRIDLSNLLAKMGTSSHGYALKILKYIPERRMEEVLLGITDSGNIELLFHLMLRSDREMLRHYAAWHIALLTRTTNLEDFQRSIDISDINDELLKKVDPVVKLFMPEKLINSKTVRLSFLMCYFIGCYLSQEQSRKMRYEISLQPSGDILYSPDILESIHPVYRYLISVFLYYEGFAFSRFNLIGKSLRATESGLISHFKSSHQYTKVDKIISFLAIVPFTILNFLVLYNTVVPVLFISILLTTSSFAIVYMVYYVFISGNVVNERKGSLWACLYVWIFFPFRQFHDSKYWGFKAPPKYSLAYVGVTITMLLSFNLIIIVIPFPASLKLFYIILGNVMWVATYCINSLSIMSRFIKNKYTMSFLGKVPRRIY